MQPFSLSIVLATALVALQGPASAATHPSLVFDGAGLERLQARKSDATHAELAAALRAGMDRLGDATISGTTYGDPRFSGNAVAGQALAAVILGDAPSLARAKKNLLASARWSDWGFGEGDDLNRAHLILGVSLAYDVLHAALTEAERATVRRKLGAEAARYAAAADVAWWKHGYMNNHNWINFAAVGLAGLALEGEDPRAAGWLAQARANDAALRPVLELLSDGSWHEGVGYLQYGVATALPYWMAARRRGEAIDDVAVLRAFGNYRLRTQLPNSARTYITTHGDWSGWAGPNSGQLLRYTAARFQDPAAQEAGRRWAAAGPRSTQPYDLLPLALEYVAFDPQVPNADLARTPLDGWFDDQELAVLRSGWGPGAMVLALKSGVLGGRGNFERLRELRAGSLNIGHDHMDDLGLWMYGDGEWLMPETVGYNIGRTSGPKAWMTEFHNSLLVDGKGQLGDARGGVHDALAHPWFFDRDATLPLTTSTAHYGLARGEGARLYPATTGLRSLARTVILSRDGHAVLQDRALLDAPRAMDQLFHFMDGATRDGAWVRGNGKRDRVLGVRIFSPAAATVTFGAQTADKLTKEFEPDGSIAFAKVRPTANTATPTFLELLWPTRGATWAQRPDAQPLDPARPELGFTVPLADGVTETWLFGPGRGEQGGLVLEGELAIVRRDAAGQLTRAALLGPGRVEEPASGRVVLESAQPTLVEVEFRGDVLEVSGEQVDGVRIGAPGAAAVSVNGQRAPAGLDGDVVVVGETEEGPLEPGDDLTPSNPDWLVESPIGSDIPDSEVITVEAQTCANAGAGSSVAVAAALAVVLVRRRRRALRPCRSDAAA